MACPNIFRVLCKGKLPSTKMQYDKDSCQILIYYIFENKMLKQHTYTQTEINEACMKLTCIQRKLLMAHEQPLKLSNTSL